VGGAGPDIHVYNSALEWATFGWQNGGFLGTTNNILTIGTQTTGAGVGRPLKFVVGGADVMDYGVTTAGAWSMGSGLKVNAGAAIPSGGSPAIGISITSAAAFGIFCGSGAPSLSAGTGSLYLRSDATNATTRLYINTNGAATWTAFTTIL
jgi:hypothetical protein